MSVLARLQQQAAAVADLGIDMSQVQKGGAGRRLLPAGRAFAQLIGYREFGNHVQTFNGKAKAPARVARLTFALWGKGDHTKGNEQDNCYHIVNDDGSMKQHGTFTTFDVSLGNNEKAKIKHGFDKMNWSNKHKTFATMLGEFFFLPITIKKGTKADSKPYNLIDWAAITPPLDQMTGAPYAAPSQVKDEDFFAFLWDMPTKEDWEAMFIEGTNDKGQSKNFLQGMCLKAKDFPGSPLEHLLLELNGGVLPDLGNFESDDDPEADQEQAAPQTSNVPAVPTTQVAPVPDPTAPPAVPVVDPVAAAAAVVAVSIPDVPFDGGVIPETPTVPVLNSIPGM
ncbi:hypothetical protein D3C77_34610 [compost metagenome]